MKHRPKGGKELFTFNFSLDNHLELLKISTSEGERHGRFVVLGTQGDNLAQEFVFERNLEYANDDLVLAFKNSRESFGEINLGSGNTYQIPNALTQLRELSMQVIIKSGDQIKASSNTIDFELRKAITPGSSPVETIPNPVKELEEQAMVGDIKAGKINLVITKDLSRFGRNYVDTGYYIEQVFDSHNVRYVAIDDSVDTLQGENMVMPIKNIMNDWYAKDISKKTKSALNARAKNGQYMASKPAYGYAGVIIGISPRKPLITGVSPT